MHALRRSPNTGASTKQIGRSISRYHPACQVRSGFPGASWPLIDCCDGLTRSGLMRCRPRAWWACRSSEDSPVIAGSTSCFIQSSAPGPRRINPAGRFPGTPSNVPAGNTSPLGANTTGARRAPCDNPDTDAPSSGTPQRVEERLSPAQPKRAADRERPWRNPRPPPAASRTNTTREDHAIISSIGY